MAVNGLFVELNESEKTKEKHINTIKMNTASAELITSCLASLDKFNSDLAEFGPDSDEFKQSLEQFKPIREDCNKTIELVKNECERTRNTEYHFETCDDPRLDKFPI